jgi:hypothetical protein
MLIDQRVSPAKVSPLEFISAFDTEWKRIADLSQSSTTGSCTYRKIVKDLFTCQEAKRDFLFAWFAESDDNIVKNLLSKDHLTNHEAKEHILNLPSNHCSPCGGSSKNSKAQHKANAVALSNATRDKNKKQGSSSSPNSGGKEYNWFRKQSPGTASSHTWTSCKDLKVWRDRHGAEMGAPI